MRLIDADALLEELKKTGRYFQAKFDIENAPTVEPERQQGEWIEKVETKQLGHGWLTTHEIVCSVCGGSGENDENIPQCWKFCPNCGADMRGGTDCMDEDAKQASIPYTYNAPQHDWKCGYPDNNACWWDGYNTAKKEFSRPIGKWIEGENGNIKCNKCGCEIRYSYLMGNKPDYPIFCCDCGAKMKGGAEE